MPYYDGTGPFGDGRLGRGMGPCGRGGRAFGARGGLRRRLGAGAYRSENIYPYTKDSLQAQKHELEQQIKWIEEELNKEN